MRFDLMMTSSAYVFEAQPGSFSRRRLYQALALPEVTAVLPLYHGSGRWLDPDGGVARDVFVIGFNPHDAIFNVPEIERQTDALRRPDTVLVDTDSRPELGPLRPDREIEIEQRKITIGGSYHLGTGFVGLGVAMTSDLNFARIFPQQTLNEVSLGLLTLRADADPDQVARHLRESLPPDAQVLTRAELFEHETSHWIARTSTGLIFGFGLIVAVVVGLVILNQTLSTQITRQLPQFATLKALGYTDRDLTGIVVTLAVIMSTTGFIPAAAMAIVIYGVVRRLTMLPIEMTSARVLAVLAIAWIISVLSAVFALHVMRRADPVDLF
jgi:putative ABC transport system permease protein